MQISATIMRLVVILSVLVQIYANTGGSGGPWTTRHGLVVAGPPVPVARSFPSSVGSVPVVQGDPTAAKAAGRPERNVYRTKLSRLRLILLADMLNEIPPPQLELITCLANSTTLNVTTKHCDCETYPCKDLLASSSPSPLNYIQPKRKIHTSCREHCCRKKKFNRSIDPAALENVVASSSHPSSSRRYNVVPDSSTVHRLPLGALSFAASATAGKRLQPSETSSSFRVRTTGLPSPAVARDQRDRPAACSSDGIEPISIATGDGPRAPWLYRVSLIETKHPVCVGALIHPSLILTTAVCVINRKPEELVVWSGPETTPDRADGRRWTTVGRILLPEKFVTTFERLENNVALLVLLHPEPQPSVKDSPTDPPITVAPRSGGLRAWTVSDRGAETAAGRNLARAQELFQAQRKRTPASICLSSIIDRRPAPPERSCYVVSVRKRADADASTSPRPATGDGGDGSTGSADKLLAGDGTNYVTTNISIFPATECRPEHREYLQHEGNLCAGYGAARNRSIDVDYSGSPLICDEPGADGKLHRTVRGLLTWSTGINHAPHLFTNLTAYRQWIEREMEKLNDAAQTRTAQPQTQASAATVYPHRSVLYG